MTKTKFTEEIGIFPASEQTNQTIAQHPAMMQHTPDLDAECRVGKNEIRLPLFTGIPPTVFKSFKKANMSFYAFTKKVKKSGRTYWQYFYSQKTKNADNPLTEEIEKLTAKLNKK